MRDLVPFDALPPDIGPFQDANFKLTVLAELIETGVLDFGEFDDFLKFIEGPQYDYEQDGYTASAKAYDYLSRYPLSDAQLAAVQFLEFDGGLVIYEFIAPFWGGESEAYNIQSLTDIALLPNLKRLGIHSMLATTDLRPLRSARNLERVTLGLTGKWENMDALLALPRLKMLMLFKSDVSRRDQRVTLTALKSNGVKISELH